MHENPTKKYRNFTDRHGSVIHRTIWRIIFLLAGFFICLAVQHVLEWKRLDASPLAWHALSPAIRDDFAVTIRSFSQKHALTEPQLGWLVFQHGFSGFSRPIMEKGGVVVGRNYFSTSRGSRNVVTIGNETVHAGSRESAQLVIIDSGAQKILGTVGLSPASSINDLEFLVFTPSEIRQFGMNTASGWSTLRAD